MKVCLFDIDGTLVHTGGAGRAALVAALQSEFGIDDPPADVVTLGRTDRGIANELFARHDIHHSPETWRRFVDGYLADLEERLPTSQGQVLPGIAELLETLADRDDVALGLLTGNVREGARRKLLFYGLWQHFDFGGFGDAHLDRNAVAREALESARRHLGADVAPQQVCVFGDTVLDIRCARAIGARAIAVATGGIAYEELRDAQPDLLLHDLSDPTKVFELWNE